MLSKAIDNINPYDPTHCELCPRRCGADRTRQAGACGETDELRAARAALHFGEEPCISGTRGSGAVFFCGCPLRCVFCQNAEISVGGQVGQKLDTKALSNIFLSLQAQGAHNINLVTPTHFAPHVCAAVLTAKENGLSLPVVCNTSGYESENTMAYYADCVDVFLPDYKYLSQEKAKRYSAAADYPEAAERAIREMVRLRGETVFDAQGMLVSGVLVRHLVLPENTNEAMRILGRLFSEFGNDIAYSIMSQYTPLKSSPYAELNRTLYRREYEKVLEYALTLGITNGYTQEKSSVGRGMIPAFDGTGLARFASLK